MSCQRTGVDARGRHVAVAWFTASAKDGQAFVAFSDDAGRTFSRPIRVDEQACRGHLDVELLATARGGFMTESTEGRFPGESAQGRTEWRRSPASASLEYRVQSIRGSRRQRRVAVHLVESKTLLDVRTARASLRPVARHM